jgi:tetratricopeptide (TPR) repeat protein
MIHELSGRRLVTVKQLPNSGEAYSIHRLLQQKVLLDMEDLGFVDAYRKAFRLIRKKFPRANPQQVPTPSSWPICSEYMRHVFTLHRVHCQNAPSAPMMDMDPADIAKLFYDAGFYIWSSQTNSYDGLSFLQTAAKILEDSGHDENSRIRADILCVHGLQLLNMGCVERAQGPKLLERALKIRKRLYEENKASRDDDVLHQNAANDYALCLLNKHEFDRAGEIIRSCRERYLYWGTEDSNPWENSKYYGNYSIVLMWKGELDMAITYQEKSLQLMEQSVAGRSTQYYRRAYMLGCYLLQKEDLEGALEKHLEVLTARLEMQGKHHAHTMMSMYAVGAMYHHLGKPNMAM